MSNRFDRKVELLIGQRGRTGRLITDLRVAFKVEKSLESNPNAAQIDVYNLNAESRAALEKKETLVRLKVGYGSDVRTLFVGDVAVVTTRSSGPDVVTTIEAGDGELPFQTSTAHLSFAPGTRVGQILDSLVERFGLSRGEVKGLNVNDQYINGATFSGLVKDHLDTLLGKQGLRWSIQDDQLQILPVNTATSGTAVVLTPETGLIGSPHKRVVVNTEVTIQGKATDSGVQVASLLNPSIRPGGLIKVQAKYFEGVFTVQKVIHTGDTHAGNWFSEVEAV